MNAPTSDEEEQGLADHDPRPRILDSLGESHRVWQETVMSLPEDVATRRPEGGWSPVDAWIHVTAWKANSLAVARLATDPANGIDPSKGVAANLHLDVDGFNQRVLIEHAGWSVEQALAWAGEIDTGLREAIGSLPPDLLLREAGSPVIAAWCDRPLMLHPGEHLRDLGGLPGSG